jgi:hypothetical protein
MEMQLSISYLVNELTTGVLDRRLGLLGDNFIQDII